MKTFEEALATVYRIEEAGTPVGHTIPQLKEELDRRADIVQEARLSPNLESGMRAWMTLIRTHSPEDALFSAFTAGLITGMEMEKAE